MPQQSKNSFYNFHFTDGNKYFEFFRGCCKLALAAVCIKRSYWKLLCWGKGTYPLWNTSKTGWRDRKELECGQLETATISALNFSHYPHHYSISCSCKLFSALAWPIQEKKKYKNHQTTISCKVIEWVFIHHQKSSFKGSVPLHIIQCHYSTDFNRKTKYFKPLKLKNNFWYSVFS